MRSAQRWIIWILTLIVDSAISLFFYCCGAFLRTILTWYFGCDAAMELALSLEKLTNEKLLNLHHVSIDPSLLF